MFPKKIKIGAFTYTVEFLDGEMISDRYGQCMHKEQKIILATGMTDERMKEVLLHEILHAIVFNFNIPYGGVEEEQIVNGFGLGLATVFNDNRKLREYLLS